VEVDRWVSVEVEKKEKVGMCMCGGARGVVALLGRGAGGYVCLTLIPCLGRCSGCSSKYFVICSRVLSQQVGCAKLISHFTFLT
jgi:hypothetical protein